MKPDFRVSIHLEGRNDQVTEITGLGALRETIAKSRDAAERGVVLAQIEMHNYPAEDLETFALPASTEIRITGVFVPHEPALRIFEEMRRAIAKATAPAQNDQTEDR